MCRASAPNRPMGGCTSTTQGLNKTSGKRSRKIAKELGPSELFTDAEFPAANSSLYYDDEAPYAAWKEVQWRRASQAFDGPPEMFKGAASASTVHQGHLGNCWFISALSIIATRPDILNHLIVAQYPQHGLFEFRFFKQGKWVNVIVDDALPFRADGTLLFARSHPPGQLWVPLLEKAYAKLHGSYQALSGGEISYALVDLTGGASEYIRLDSSIGENLKKKQWLIAKMRQGMAEWWLMGSSFRKSSDQAAGAAGEPEGAHGLIAGHAYAILGLQDVVVRGGVTTLVKLRNPWGQGEWRGAWADDAPEWDAEPRLKQDLLQRAEDDGVFWMAYPDWERHAAYFSVCRTYRNNVGDPFYVITEPRGAWSGSSAGGAGSHRNPQYIVMAEQTSAVFVYLMQDDHRYIYKRGDYDYAGKAMGLCLAHADDDKRLGKEIFSKGHFKFGTHFIHSRSIGAEFVLEEGECYDIMPVLKEAGQEAKYQMYVFSTRPVRMKKTTEECKEEDEYDSVPLANVTKKLDHVAWDPWPRTHIYNGAPDMPSAMETDTFSAELRGRGAWLPRS